jgi:hypothetical protein
MPSDLGRTMALAAASGLLAGLAACGSAPVPPLAPKPAADAHGPTDADATPDLLNGDKECCRGKNECKGRGNCRTDQSACAGQNACKGQGGCKAPDCKTG